MGFLRFKKDKNKLDLPPAPPIGGLPSLEKEFPSLPEMPPAPSEDLPEPPLGGELPPIEDPLSMPKPSKPVLKPAPMPEPKPVFEPKPMPEPKPAPQPSMPIERSGKPIYMEVDKYRDILDSITSIKDSTKSAEDALNKISDLHNSRDREIGRWHARMEDIQRKLSFIDKSLFEGN